MAPVVAVASGKGGTGKTTLAVNLALRSPPGTMLLDCDVEAPNARIFLKPVCDRKEEVTVPKPDFDPGACNGCGRCREACRFNAIVILAGRPTHFPELCHSCGGCVRRCPSGAIRELEHTVGHLETGTAGFQGFAQGLLKIGEARGAPVIARVKEEGAGWDLVVIDAPPGTSCPMVESVREADFVVLVTEPTPFGLHDLKLAADTVRRLAIPFGVVINKAGLGDGKVRDYCIEEEIPVLGVIPFDRRIAELCARGETIGASLPLYGVLFDSLKDKVLSEVPA